MSRHLIISEQLIVSKIYFIRGQRVMLDRDLAIMYGVTTGNLNKAVKRKIRRFPSDFMFQLTKQEFKNLIFQIGISSWGGVRKLPFAFTQPGIAMLSSVLNSEIADEANIHIMRVFTKLGELLSAHKDILLKLEQLEKKLLKQDSRTNRHERDIKTIFMAIRELMEARTEDSKQRNKIGYKRQEELKDAAE